MTSTAIIINAPRNEFPLAIGLNRGGYSGAGYKTKIVEREPNQVLGETIGGDVVLTAVNKQSQFAMLFEHGATSYKEVYTLSSIVMNAVRASTMEDMYRFVENFPTDKLPPILLLFGNQRKVFLAQSYVLQSMWITELPQGVHTIDTAMDNMFFAETTSYIHKMFNHRRERPWLECYGDMKRALNSSLFNIRRKFSWSSKTGTASSTIMAFNHTGLMRFKYYDRTIKHPPRKEGEPFVPRYHDYIEIWRNPDAILQIQDPAVITEEDGELEDAEETKRDY